MRRKIMETRKMKRLERLVAVYILVTVCIGACIFASCNDGMSGTSRMSESGQNRRLNRSQRTIIDAGKYTDLTVTANDAQKIAKEDILFMSFGEYKIEGGNSAIKIDRRDGSVTLTSDDAFYKGEGGRQLYAKYRFDVSAANPDCLYIKAGNKQGAVMLIGSEKFEGEAMPDLALCLPLYGFGQNRIAVSPVMNGYIAMPSGTYWKKN
jgi:hypothetical protein